MSQARHSSASKALFWGLLILVIISFAGLSMGGMFLGCSPWISIRGIEHLGPQMGWRDVMWPNFIHGMVRPFTFFLVYVVVVAALVYRDAAKRGMDPWLWAAVAAFVPFLIGVVIYLVVRSNGRAACANCGKTIRADYKVCPYCGKSRELLCTGCRRPVSPDWKVCPFCETNLVSAPGPQPTQG